MIESITYMKREDIPEHKEVFTYGFKQVKTNKIEKYILIGCESDDLYAKDNLSNF